MVLRETKKYRLRQDLIGQFANEKTIASEGGIVSKQELTQTWKLWLEQNHSGGSAPKVLELVEYMNNNYEREGKSSWKSEDCLWTAVPTDDLGNNV